MKECKHWLAKGGAKHDPFLIKPFFALVSSVLQMKVVYSLRLERSGSVSFLRWRDRPLQDLVGTYTETKGPKIRSLISPKSTRPKGASGST